MDGALLRRALPRSPRTGACPGARLAEYHAVPGPYLAKHLQALTRAGVLESVPGPKGGYRLARPADEITMLEVVEAIDGPRAGVHLQRDPAPRPGRRAAGQRTTPSPAASTP